MLTRRNFLRAGLLAGGIVSAASLFDFKRAAASHGRGVNGGWQVADDGTILTDYYGLADMAESVGAKFVRFEVRNLHYQLEQYQTVYDRYQAKGIGVLPVIDYTSHPGQWAEWNKNNAERQGGNGKNKFIEELVALTIPFLEIFGSRSVGLECWNEPNSHWYLYPSVFAQLLTAMRQAINEKAPGLRLVMGGMDSYGNYVPSRYYVDTKNAGRRLAGWSEGFPMNAVGYHPYPDKERATTESKILEHLQRMWNVVDVGLPLWLTEFGWESSVMSDDTAEGERIQAENIAKFYSVIEANRDRLELDQTYQYCLLDYPAPERVETWGLFAMDKRRKPAADVFAR